MLLCCAAVALPKSLPTETHLPTHTNQMKTNKLILGGSLVLALSSVANGQTVINITGATAFRAAANNSIIAILGGSGVTKYAFTGSQGIGGTNRAIFKGTVAGIGPVVVRASWSGSTQGIADIAAGTPVQVLEDDEALLPTTTAGANVTGPFEGTNQVAQFAFSDVSQATSGTLSPSLTGVEVGVVPFAWVANSGAPAGMTNVTDQIVSALYGGAAVPLRLFTGVAADTSTVYASGRNDGSGSRALVLSETRYGAFSTLQQFIGVTNQNTGAMTSLTYIGIGGFSSNSGIRDLVFGLGTAVSVDGAPPESVTVVSYLTISDWLAATVTGKSFDPDGAGPLPSQNQKAKGLTYNGVAYSENGVKQGAYTLWGYQWLYQAPTITATQLNFYNQFTAAIPANLGTAAIPIPAMTATRAGGDGGPVAP